MAQHVEQLEGLRHGGIDDRSLAAARGKTRAEFQHRLADPRALARWVATQRALGQSAKAIAERWTRPPPISDQALRRIATSIFHPPHLDFVAVPGSLGDDHRLDMLGDVIGYTLKTTDDGPR